MGARSLGGNYYTNITTNSWIRGSDGMYTMTILNDYHSLGAYCHLHVTRYDNGAYKPVVVPYEIATNGDITAYSSEPFSGMAYVVSGV